MMNTVRMDNDSNDDDDKQSRKGRLAHQSKRESVAPFFHVDRRRDNWPTLRSRSALIYGKQHEARCTRPVSDRCQTGVE